MNELANSVQWLWAFSVLAQLVLLSILVTKGHYRKLPLLTLYVALNICQAAFLYFVYVRLGYQSVYVRKVAWMSQAATLLTQAFATTEILRLVLRPYRGIWGLAWRMLVAISSVAIVYISAAAKGDWNWALVELDRGYHLMFAIAVISCLLLMRYYSVPLFPSYKAISARILFLFLYDDLSQYHSSDDLVPPICPVWTGLAACDDWQLCYCSNRLGGCFA